MPHYFDLLHPNPPIMAKRVIKSDNDSFLETLGESTQSLWDFLLTYQVELLILASLIALFVWFTKRNKKQAAEIRKMWIFTLFFLTKRQMMIPLVVTLTKKDGILDEDIQDRLLEIRKRCRMVSLKTDPINRLNLEQQVSKILFFYFTNLENEGKIKKGSKFEKIVKDLEFIDGKLVQLQHIYNREAEKWNRRVTSSVFGWIYSLFRFHPFEKFEMPK